MGTGEHTFGPRLHYETRRGLHDPGTHPSGSGNQERLSLHRRKEAPAFIGRGEGRPPLGQVGERHAPDRNPATVDHWNLVGEIDPTRSLRCLGHVMGLHRMLGMQIAGGIDAEMAAHREKAGVLARAIVVTRVGCDLVVHQGVRRRLVKREMGTAFEGVGAEPESMEPRSDRVDVPGLTVMTRARKRQVALFKVERIGCARGDQGEGLDRLHRRTGQGPSLGLAEPGSMPVGADNGDIHLVVALHHSPTSDFNNEWR